MTVLQVENLSVYVKDTQKSLVQDISFELNAGQSLALMGASGSGKSLTVMALLGVLPPSLEVRTMRMEFSGQLQQNAKENTLNFALIMQNPADCFDPLYNIEQHFAETLTPYLSRAKIKTYMLELLDEVGLMANVANCYPFELSGGMLHRVMIAIAIAQVQVCKASVIIADEPIAGLDCAAKSMLLQKLKELQKKYGFALLYIDHDLDAARLMADELAIMQDGKIIEYGSMQTVIEQPQHNYTRELVKTFKLLSALEPKKFAPYDFNDDHAKPENVLSCVEVSKTYATRDIKKTALHNISFALKRGESLGIVGNNGAGKSTLLRLLLGLEKLDDGSIQILNTNVVKFSHKRHWRKHIQAVFQHARMAVNPRMQVQDILLEPLRAHKLIDKNKEKQEVIDLLQMVKLPENYAKAYPQQMSGGQLQRLCIARALALKPEILLLDEPLSDLDAVVAERILLMLDELKKSLNIAVLYISHDIRSVLRLCERVMVLHEGQLVDEFLAHEYNTLERHSVFGTMMDNDLSKCFSK